LGNALQQVPTEDFFLNAPNALRQGFGDVPLRMGGEEATDLAMQFGPGGMGITRLLEKAIPKLKGRLGPPVKFPRKDIFIGNMRELAVMSGQEGLQGLQGFLRTTPTRTFMGLQNPIARKVFSKSKDVREVPIHELSHLLVNRLKKKEILDLAEELNVLKTPSLLKRGSQVRDLLVDRMVQKILELPRKKGLQQ